MLDKKFTYHKVITQREIDDIMDSALRGISYWAGEAKVYGFIKDEDQEMYASEALTRGYRIGIYDAEDEKWLILTINKFLQGMSLYEGSTEPTEIDDLAADSIIQYALFGKQVYA